MADDFRVQISAELNKSSINNIASEIKTALGNKQIPISIKLNSNSISSIKSQIENSLSKIKIPNISGSAGTTGSISSTKEIINGYQKIRDTLSQINSIKIKQARINNPSSVNQIKTYGSQLQSLKSQYDSLMSSFGKNLSTSQFDKLNTMVKKTSNTIEQVKAKIKDVNSAKISDSSTKGISNEYQKIRDTLNQINSIKLKKAGLDSSNVNQIKTYESQLQSLKTKYDGLMNSFGKNLSTSQFSQLNAMAEKTKATLDQISAKSKDINLSKISNIKSEISNGKLDLNMSSMTKSLSAYDGQTSSSLEKVRSTFKEIQSLQKSLSNPSQMSGKDLTSTYDRYTESVKRFGIQMRTVANESSKSISRLEASTAGNKMLNWLNNNSRASKMYGDSIKSLANNASLAKTKGELSQIQTEFKNITAQAEATGKVGNSVFSGFTNGAEKLMSYVGGYRLLSAAFRELKEGVQFVTDLDSALTTINMTMPSTQSELANLSTSALTMSKDLGASATDVLSVAQIYANANTTIKDVLERTKSTVMLSTATNLSSTDASNSIQAIINQFKLSTDDSMQITDVLENISSKLAIEFGQGVTDMTQAVQVSGSVANEAGMDWQQYLAIVGKVAEVTRSSGSSIGASMKTIFSRITRSNTEDATAEEISNADKAFKSVGVSVRDSNGEFRDVADTLSDLSDVWGNLNSVQRSYVAEQASGVRQKDKFIAMMNNWGESEQLYQEALTSDGFAEEVNDKYLDSVNGKLKILQATAQSFWASFINSDVLKAGIDSLTTLLDILDKIISTFGSVPVLGLGVGIASFAKQYGDSLKNPVDITTGASAFSNTASTLNTASDAAETARNISESASDASKAASTIGKTASDAVHDAGNLLETTGDFTEGIGDIAKGAGNATDAIGDIAKGAGNATEVVGDIAKSADSIGDAVEGVADFGEATGNMAKNLSGVANTADAIQDVSVAGMAMGSAAGGVSSFGSALLSFVTSPIFLVGAGLVAGIAAWNAWQKSVEDAFNSAKEAAQDWKAENDSLEEQKAKVTDLRTSLSSGNLTDEEIYNTKLQILDIQNQITEQYGAQAAGIDLVNGDLETQLGLLSEISAKNAQKTLDLNADGFNTAQNQMSKKRDYILAQDVGKYFKGGEDVLNIAEKFKDRGISLQDSWDGSGALYNIRFEGDATQAESVLTDFMNELRNVRENVDADSQELIDQTLSSTQGVFKENDEVLSKYRDTFKNYLSLSLATEKTDKNGINPSDTYNKYAEAVDAYNKALSSGDTTQIDKAKSSFDEVKSAVDVVCGEYPQYQELFSDVGNELNNTAIKANEFNKALSGNDTSKNGSKIKDLSNQLKELGYTSADIKSALFSTDSSLDGSDTIKSLAELAGVDLSNITEANLSTFLGSLEQAGVIADPLAESIENTAKSVEDLTTSYQNATDFQAAFNTAITESASATGLSTDSITAIKSAYSDLEGYNPEKLFEATANGIHLNSKELTKLQSQYYELQGIDLDNSLSDLMAKLNAEYSKGSDANATLISDYQEQIESVKLLQSQYEGLTSAYNNWVNAQSSSENGDMYDAITGSIESAKEQLDSGLVGTNEFRALTDLYAYGDQSTASVDELVNSFNNALPVIEKFFTSGKDGAQAFVDEFATLNDVTGQYSFNFNDDQIAQSLGIDVEAVQAMIKKLGDYGFDIDLGDSLYELDELGRKADESVNHLDALFGDDLYLKFNFDSTDINDLNSQIKEAEANLSAFRNEDGTVNLALNGASDAINVLMALNQQKQLCSQPVIMSIDTGQVDGKLGDYISKLQEYQNAINNLNTLKSTQAAGVDVDTSQAQQKVDSLLTDIQSLSSENPTITASLNVDATSEASLNSSLESMTTELTVKAGVDSKAVEAYDPEDKPATVKFDKDSTIPDSYKPSDKTAFVHYQPVTSNLNTWQPPVKLGTILYNPVISGGVKQGSKVNGSAHIKGTAFSNGTLGRAYSSGDWSLKQNENALVGELGQEIVVRDGRFFTVGDYGTEITSLKKGDIVFNHLQSKALLENGYVTGRGTLIGAKANGTAYSAGSGKFYGTNVPVTTATSTTTTTSSSNTANNSNNSNSDSATNSSTQATQANTQATKENTSAKSEESESTKDTSKAYDWLETRIKSFGNATKRIADSITDYVSFAFKSRQLKKQIKSVSKEQALNEQGYSAYMGKANSVGLEQHYVDLVKSGAIAFEDIQDEDLQKRIDDYTSWYEKAMDCKDAIQDLKNTQLELFEDWANIPIEKAEKKIDKLTQKFNILDAKYSTVSSGGSSAANLEKLQKAQYKTYKKKYDTAKDNYTQAKEENKNAKQAIKRTSNILKKANSLTKSQKKDVKSGNVIDTSNLSKKDRIAANEYNYFVEYQKQAQKDVKSTKEKYNTAKKTLAPYKSNYELSKKYSGQPSFKYANALLEQELSNQKNQDKQLQKAYNTSIKNTQKQEKVQKAAQKKVSNKSTTLLKDKSITDNLSKAQQKALKAGKTVSTSGITDPKTLARIKEYNKLVTKAKTETDKYNIALEAQSTAAEDAQTSQAELAKAITETATSQLDNIQKYYQSKGDYIESMTNKIEDSMKLKEAQGIRLSASDYQAQIDSIKSSQNNYIKMQSDLQKQLNKAVNSGAIKRDTEEWWEWQTQIESVSSSISDCDVTMQELSITMQELPLKRLQDELDLLDAQKSSLESYISLLKARNQDLSMSDYTNQISDNIELISKNQAIMAEARKNASKYSTNNEYYQQYMETYYQADAAVNKLLADNEELKDSMRDDIYFREFERAITSIEHLRKSYQTLSDLIDDDIMYDDSGDLTNYGISKLAMNIEELNSYKDEISVIQQKIAQIKRLRGTDGYSEEEYLEDLRKAEEDLEDALKGGYNIRKKILDIAEKQSKFELDSINDIIDARKKALQRKKDYYDYDKNLKSKAKEIQLLKQQIAALDGVTDAESRAQKARLQAQLEEATNELNDTIKDHVYELEIQGLDDLKAELAEDYNNYVKDLSDNLEVIERTLQDVTNAVNSSAGEVSSTIRGILAQFGVVPDDIGMTGYASGTKYVSQTGLKRTNENGEELIISKGGIVTPLIQGDAVFNAKLTKRLFDMAENYNGQSLSVNLPEIPSNSLVNSGISPINAQCIINVNGNADESTVLKIKNLMPTITKQVVNSIQKDARKGGNKAIL